MKKFSVIEQELHVTKSRFVQLKQVIEYAEMNVVNKVLPVLLNSLFAWKPTYPQLRNVTDVLARTDFLKVHSIA